MRSAGDLVICLGCASGHSRHINGLMGFIECLVLLEFCLKKELCVSNTWPKSEEKRKVTLRMDENETKIDFVLTKKEHRLFKRNVKAIPGEFQQALMIAYIDKKKIRKVVEKAQVEGRKITLL